MELKAYIYSCTPMHFRPQLPLSRITGLIPGCPSKHPCLWFYSSTRWQLQKPSRLGKTPLLVVKAILEAPCSPDATSRHNRLDPLVGGHLLFVPEATGAWLIMLSPMIQVVTSTTCNRPRPGPPSIRFTLKSGQGLLVGPSFSPRLLPLHKGRGHVLYGTGACFNVPVRAQATPRASRGSDESHRLEGWSTPWSVHGSCLGIAPKACSRVPASPPMPPQGESTPLLIVDVKPFAQLQ
ncbi:hypothetical protein Syun_014461 [Stephania yunnanensis]|uniref:Uncharacterized protein n=1 Tax=Stephania yunnanensis TaxID=152371 RepID=A0AAP0PBX8_9MAGN